MNFVLHTLNWQARNEHKLKRIGAVIENASEDVKFVVNGCCSVLLLVPQEKDSVIMALNGGEELETQPSACLTRFIELLNEKLERLDRRRTDCIITALDLTLQSLTKFCYTAPVYERYKNLPDSFVCESAAKAGVECRDTLFQEELDLHNMEDILAWCSVNIDERRHAVILEIDTRAVFYDSENVCRALGFPYDGSNLMIQVGFDDHIWEGSRILDNSLEVFEVKVSVPISEDEKMFGAGSLIRYGCNLVEDMVKEFLRSLYEKSMEGDENEVEEQENVFVRILKYVWDRLMKLKTLCVSCGEPSESRFGFCDKELCMYKFEEVSFEISLLQELKNKDLIEFELATASAAAIGTRDIFEPFPSFLLEGPELRGRSGFFSGQKIEPPLKKQRFSGVHNNKNMELLKQIIASFPPISVMQRCENEMQLKMLFTTSVCEYKKTKKGTSEKPKGLHEALEDHPKKDHQLAYDVFKFILFTNRNFLRPLLNETQKLPVNGANKQFIVIYDSKEEAFNRMTDKHGSIFAFHGSAACNWFSIVRNGLKSCSNTKYMSTGNAYGSGIYLASTLSLALSYASNQLQIGQESSSSSSCYNVVALCEVVNRTNYLKGNDIYVVPAQRENEVRLRYLLLLLGNASSRLYICNRSLHRTDAKSIEKTDLFMHYHQQMNSYKQGKLHENFARRNETVSLLRNKREAAVLHTAEV